MWRVRARKSFFQKTLEVRRGGFLAEAGTRRATPGDGRTGVWHGRARFFRGGVAKAGREGGRCSAARRGAVGGIGWGCRWVWGSGDWVGMKGELSLASANPQRGFALARDSLGRFFGGWATTVGAGRGRPDGPGDAGCVDGATGWGGGVLTVRGRSETGDAWRGTSGDAGDARKRQSVGRGGRAWRFRGMDMGQGASSVHWMLTTGKGDRWRE